MTGAITAFVRMYEPHEAREDTVVFPAFRALLSADELDELASTFAELQRSQFGPGRRSPRLSTMSLISSADSGFMT